MVAEPELERGRGALLVRVHGHQGGIHVDDQRQNRVDDVVRGVLASQLPRRRASGGAGDVDRPQRRDRVVSEPVDRAGHRRIRCDQPEQTGFSAQQRDVDQAVPPSASVTARSVIVGLLRQASPRRGAVRRARRTPVGDEPPPQGAS
jgi:hypothetical protein